jgi:hypothetical protein
MLVDRHSTDFGGNHGQGLLVIPHGPDLATNCARVRLTGPLSWLQVQRAGQRRTTPFQRIYGHVRGLGGRNRPAQSNSTAKLVPEPFSRRARRPQVHVERECPDRANSRFPIRENGQSSLRSLGTMHCLYWPCRHWGLRLRAGDLDLAVVNFI